MLGKSDILGSMKYWFGLDCGWCSLVSKVALALEIWVWEDGDEEQETCF